MPDRQHRLASFTTSRPPHSSSYLPTGSSWSLTFVVVVLHRDDAASGGLGVVNDGLGVQGFDGERVDHADVDSFWIGFNEGRRTSAL